MKIMTEYATIIKAASVKEEVLEIAAEAVRISLIMTMMAYVTTTAPRKTTGHAAGADGLEPAGKP